MDPLRQQADAVLRHWPDAGGARVERIRSESSLSDSAAWRVALPAGDRFLKRHAASAHAGRLQCVHGLQRHLAAQHPEWIARLFATDAGHTAAQVGGFVWQLEAWLAGEPGGAAEGDGELQLVAAAGALAQLHLAAASFAGADAHGAAPQRCAPAPTIEQRHALGERLLAGGLADLAAGVARAPGKTGTALRDAAAQVAAHLPGVVTELSAARETPFALQWVLGDVWQGNVLFRGDAVAGFVDLAAARVSVPTADLTRLLGSLAGDDRSCWRAGLAAYESVRRLPDDELRVIDLLRRSEVVLAAANWVTWLSPGAPLAKRAGQREWVRLGTLLERLRALQPWS